MKRYNTRRFVIGADSESNQLNLWSNASGMRILSQAEISIETGHASNPLVRHIITMYCTRVDATGPYNNTSDDNVKSYEEAIVSATETLLKLKPKKQKKHIDLYTSEENIPELSYLVTEGKLHEMKEQKVKFLCYNDLIAYLVKGFQEQKAEIESLKERIQTLENKQTKYVTKKCIKYTIK